MSLAESCACPQLAPRAPGAVPPPGLEPPAEPDRPRAPQASASTEAGQGLGPHNIRHIEPVLMAFALRAVRRRDTAQDLVQETFVAAIENQASFQGRSQLRTWLVGILGRKIADYFRKNGREVPTETLPEPTAPSRLAPQHADRQDVRLDHRRAVGVVERAMGRLSELERTAVLLCDVEQMSRAEAAGVMDVRPPHLRVLLHRGRHKLRRALERAELGQAQVPT